MKRTASPLMILIAAATSLLASACSDESSTLTNGGGSTRSATPPPEDTPGAAAAPPGDPTVISPAEAAQVRAVGSPEVTSRLHGCGKLTVGSLGSILDSRGLKGGGTRPNGRPSGQQIFDANETPAALGAANYTGRSGEAAFASTSAVSKMFDIFTMSSYDATADGWSPPACPGVKFVDGGKVSKDAISCLIGKPATDEHVAIANDAIAKNAKDGANIAVAALLAAAHTCQ